MAAMAKIKRFLKSKDVDFFLNTLKLFLCSPLIDIKFALLFKGIQNDYVVKFTSLDWPVNKLYHIAFFLL
jgi:hypothetical protein